MVKTKKILKKTIIIGLICYSTFNSYCQIESKKVDILWGTEQKESKKLTLKSIVGYDNSGIYAIKTKKNANSSLTFEHYNNQLNFTKLVELDLKYKKKELDFRFIVQLNNELHLFSSFKNQKLKRNVLFVQSIDKKTLELNQDLRKIAEIDYSKNSKYNAGHFNYRISRDSSKVLIYYISPYDKDEKEQFGFHIFDKNLNQLWEKKVTLHYNDELFDVKNYQVDNYGNVHLLGIIIPEKIKGQRKERLKYKYQILSYLNSGNELKEYPIKIEGKFLTDMQIAINVDQDIICSGFYSNVYTKVHSDVGYSLGSDAITGTYFIKIDDDTKEIITKEFKEFGIDFITQNMTKKKKEKVEKKAENGKNTNLYQYDLKNIKLREDGGAILIGEQYYVKMVESRYTDSKGKTQRTKTYYYYYNDIIVIKISPNGNIEWAEKIPKRQYTVDDGGFYSSFALSVVKDKLYFVFNDHPNNLSYNGEGEPATFNKGRRSIVVLVELDSEGNQTREALFSLKKAEILMLPKICKQISENEMLLFDQRKKIHRFAKITFKE